MELTGIIDAQEFRNKILAARDHLKPTNRSPASTATQDSTLAVLQRIETKLEEITTHLKNRS
jgi:putative membrane protein